MARSARALWTARLRGGTPRPTPAGRSRAASPFAAPAALRGCRAVILGIDPSLRGTGLAVIDARGESPKLLASLTLRLPPRLTQAECLGRIAAESERLAREHGASEVSVEGTIYVQNFRTAQAMGASRGAALGAVARLGLKVAEYAPARIKQAVTGNGRASKTQVAKMVGATLGLERELPSDEADAAAAALCHAYNAR
jgi:crossover junction endodeoxyribonuclease RuvC